MAKSYDPKVYLLAAEFVDDLNPPSAEWRTVKQHELALEIQQTIEDWMIENNPSQEPFPSEAWNG